MNSRIWSGPCGSVSLTHIAAGVPPPETCPAAGEKVLCVATTATGPGSPPPPAGCPRGALSPRRAARSSLNLDNSHHGFHVIIPHVTHEETEAQHPSARTRGNGRRAQRLGAAAPVTQGSPGPPAAASPGRRASGSAAGSEVAIPSRRPGPFAAFLNLPPPPGSGGFEIVPIRTRGRSTVGKTNRENSCRLRAF